MRRQSRNPADTTCYVIAYDIPDDHRRTRVHRLLLGFGKWTQYSLFECFLTRQDFLRLQAKLAACLVETQDRVRLYPLCAACVRRVETVGQPPPEEDRFFVL
ncbi:MAG TPA: CRISPR-associated endonuclease Cas2 [Ktedonobacteraceae bacterium]|jgi:CRISPR-associated protein Cas2